METIPLTLNQLGLSGKPPAVWIGEATHPGTGDSLTSRSPIDGAELAVISAASVRELPQVLSAASEAFLAFRIIPAPVRGEFVRRIGNRFRERKSELAAMISLEAGKITQEALGEVQEVIDICDFAVGLSRQLYGLTIATERPLHRLAEQWHPLGPVGVITAFNFPMAVWAWNAALAWVCGDPVVWKPSEKTPLCALACQAVVASVLREMPEIPPGVSSVIIGQRDIGVAMSDAPELPLISATGSTGMGRAVAQRVATRLGRSLLELGGNNAMIVAPSADLELTVRAIVFSAVGTCGQRCTTLRRLIVHESLANEVIRRLKSIYERLPIGNPLEAGTLVGPLIDEGAWTAMHRALGQATIEGGTVFGGTRQTDGVPVGGVYVRPAIVDFSASKSQSTQGGLTPIPSIVQEETFAPILYVQRYQTFDEAIAIHNSVPQGLASSIMTCDMREAERFCSAAGSDCGIVNVNVGPSGAEIGGAFGGEKATGGGRESGSDSWKSYMRRTTNTINYSTSLPLAQGIQFDL
ncbi:L-piperidine-6-carboxylate dehydrogenase [Schlesneria paludicola]|uniref:L-piperidine-6-carboxylate dehydrogenase n=1 Tax=Schlesneria paludicola TaxID=360056 RepID=UPI00029A43DA|nr:aldehyde dehydrogenase family protein [Schlesneria paludicola]